MSTAVPSSEVNDPQRLSLTLDPGLVLERLILRRLSALKRKRGQDWLRSLLVQGFLAEGRWLRNEAPSAGQAREAREQPVPTTPFGHWLKARHPTKRSARISVRDDPLAVAPTPNVHSETKPFAHLRKVIG